MKVTFKYALPPDSAGNVKIVAREEEVRPSSSDMRNALEATLAAMRNLRRVAFVGTHTPRVRDPLVIEADAADKLAREVLR